MTKIFSGKIISANFSIILWCELQNTSRNTFFIKNTGGDT